jgi:hypothetical protein
MQLSADDHLTTIRRCLNVSFKRLCYLTCVLSKVSNTVLIHFFSKPSQDATLHERCSSQCLLLSDDVTCYAVWEIRHDDQLINEYSSLFYRPTVSSVSNSRGGRNSTMWKGMHDVIVSVLPGQVVITDTVRTLQPVAMELHTHRQLRWLQPEH